MEEKKILAEIITYNPDLIVLEKNIESIFKQVDKILIWDNNSTNSYGIENIILGFNKEESKIVLVLNSENLGVAQALNFGLEYALKNNYDYIYTLDQDTISKVDNINILLIALSNENIAMAGCGNSVGIDEKFPDEKNEVIKYENSLITAGTLTNVKKALGVGNYIKELFIDWVDIEFCYRLKKNGYKVVSVSNACIKHCLGNPQIRRFLWKKFTCLNYSDFRLYYIYRNLQYIKKYYSDLISKRYYFNYYFKFPISILFYENNKINKVKSIIKGIKNGKYMCKNKIAIGFYGDKQNLEI